MATKEQTEKAVKAVKNGVASKQQEEIAAKMAKQAGSAGNRARAAFQGK